MEWQAYARFVVCFWFGFVLRRFWKEGEWHNLVILVLLVIIFLLLWALEYGLPA